MKKAKKEKKRLEKEAQRVAAVTVGAAVESVPLASPVVVAQKMLSDPIDSILPPQPLPQPQILTAPPPPSVFFAPYSPHNPHGPSSQPVTPDYLPLHTQELRSQETLLRGEVSHLSGEVAQLERKRGLLTATQYYSQQNARVNIYGNGLTQGLGGHAYAHSDLLNYQTAQDPRWRPFAPVSTDMLRTLARTYDPLAADIMHLIGEVVNTPVKIVPLDAKDKSEATQKATDVANQWFSRKGGLGGVGTSRATFEGKLLRDVLEVGASALYCGYDTVGGRMDGVPDEITAVDAATIRPLITPYGFSPDDDAPCYEQWIQGVTTATFSRHDLIYDGLPMLAQTSSPYFLSMVEFIVLVVYTALKSDEWNRTWLTDGNVPDQWMKMPDTMTPEQAMEWLTLFDQMLAGNSAMRHKVKPTPGEPTGGQSRKDADFQAFENWLAARVHAVTGVNPASTGHNGGQYEANQSAAMGSTRTGRVAQLLSYRTGLYNEILVMRGWSFLQCVEATDEEEDAGKRGERLAQLIQSGQKTINEARKENGDEPYPDPGADMLLISNSLVPLSQVTPPPQPDPGQAVDPSQVPPDGVQIPDGEVDTKESENV